MDPDGPDTQVLAAAEAIRRHLDRYPAGADTLEGIAQWWLENRHPQRVIRQALELLLRQGLLERTRTADGKAVYRGAKPDD